MTNYIGIDPGKSNGCCFYDPSGWTGNEFNEAHDGEYWDHLQTNDPLQMFQWMNDRVLSADNYKEPLKIVYEMFVPEEGTHGLDYKALEVIGMLKYWAHEHSMTRGLNVALYPQLRTVKRLTPNKKLRKLGLYLSGDGVKTDYDDANDATRHVLAHIMTKGDKALIQKFGKAGWSQED